MTYAHTPQLCRSSGSLTAKSPLHIQSVQDLCHRTDVGAREETRCKSQLQTGATKESNFRRKCIRDLSTLSKPFPRSPACLSPFLTPARDFEAAAAMATPSLPPETLHHFPFMLRATRRTDGLHHKLFSPPSLSETPGSSRAADGQRRYVVPRAARLL